MGPWGGGGRFGGNIAAVMWRQRDQGAGAPPRAMFAPEVQGSKPSGRRAAARRRLAGSLTAAVMLSQPMPRASRGSDARQTSSSCEEISCGCSPRASRSATKSTTCWLQGAASRAASVEVSGTCPQRTGNGAPAPQRLARERRDGRTPSKLPAAVSHQGQHGTHASNQESRGTAWYASVKPQRGTLSSR